ncbi:peptidoglycan DD-metalloendopeptidase family protein [Moraxella marmotae]|uniref:peptidoglycan DD-metalloendopeptidase family protein n=1 Tax=Moraxella marmotae TaxID=3344520 RepID=UPI0035F24219
MTVSIAIKIQSQNPVKHLGLIVGAAMVCALAGCASKPTYNSTAGTGKTATSHQVITDSKGVPNRYQVKQGDTVSKIAQRYGLNWREVGQMNNLNSSYTIQIGQWLTLWTGTLKAREQAIKSGKHSGTNQTVITQNSRTQQPTGQPAKQSARQPVQPSYQAPAPQPPIAATTNAAAPFATGSSGVMQFRYPVGTNNPVVRRFGKATVAGTTVDSHGMWFSGRDGDSVNASNAGTVIQADRNMDGASIIIQHANGFVSSYIHIKDAQVKTGDSVRLGQRIASMKNQPSGAALLEFRVAKNGVYVDPLTVLK